MVVKSTNQFLRDVMSTEKLTAPSFFFASFVCSWSFLLKGVLMKFVAFFAVAALSLSVQAQHHGGHHVGGHHGGGHHGGGHHGGWHGGHHRHDTTVVTCSPEVVSNNLEKADAALSQLAAAELKSNATFTAKVAE